ncbi:MAG: hypothetical protein K2X38_23980 [Gemmataceae bacterium]|nr:hypothetical protein [Gemmataceae bacterium]
MLSFKHRLDRLDALLPKPPEPPPEVDEYWRRVKKVWNLNLRLLHGAWLLLSEEERQAIVKAWESWLDNRTGMLAGWLGSLEHGTSRMPKFAPQPMAAICHAWLSPEVGYNVNVRRQCGLATPEQKAPPLSEWKLLPGHIQGVGPPPWYDLPRFFDACPHCGAGHLEVDRSTAVVEKDFPWIKLDGYAGPKPVWRQTVSRRVER